MLPFIKSLKKTRITIEIGNDAITVIAPCNEHKIFVLPKGVFGSGHGMAAVLSDYIHKNFISKRLIVRMYINSRQTVIRTAHIGCPFDISEYVIQTDKSRSFTAAISISLAEAITNMCLLSGIKLYNIETLGCIEYECVKKYADTVNMICIALPQETWLRLMMVTGGSLIGVHYISFDPDFRKVELSRMALMYPSLPERVVYIAKVDCPWLEGYFTKQSIPFVKERMAYDLY